MTIVPLIRPLIRLLLLLLGILPAVDAFPAQPEARHLDCVAAMLHQRALILNKPLADPEKAATAAWHRINEEFPIQWDWLLQDGGPTFRRWFASRDPAALETKLVQTAIAGLREGGQAWAQELESLLQQPGPSDDGRRLHLYFRVCEHRRRERLRTVLAEAPRILFTKRRTIRPSFFAYTEGQSDAQSERHFLPGSQLCLLHLEDLYGRVETLISDPTGAIRDPAVSWDARRVVFAWKKSLDEDDYHLYELEVAGGRTRQLTFGRGFADYEPAFLPNGNLIFASTRCVQTVDCFWTEVSNLYTCDAEGRYLRRLGFDQVHTVYPQVLDDGRVVYTRWDYNDRGQIFPQPLFQMYPDGTAQMEYYGNSSWFPTTIAHARGIPGTGKVLAILCGHHTSQAGKLAVIDPRLGRQENTGVQLVAPLRPTLAERIDAYGQDGELWQYPYPLNERECLMTYAPLGWDRPERRRGDAGFAIYWMDFDGRRELLACDPKLPCSQPVPLVPRRKPPVVPSRVDYRQTTGVFQLDDIYAGAGLAGVPRGTIKKLRVVALEFRPAGIGQNGSAGPGGGALISTPVSIGNGAWDVKTVLGEARVYDDGSACFTVPARTPVYFQAVDARGRVVQTMRSWSTLQPGEYLGCVGCHDPKTAAPPLARRTASQAMQAGPQSLEPFYGPPRGFSFPKEIQPILDRHCIRCHKDRAPIEQLASGRTRVPLLNRPPSERARANPSGDTPAFSLLGDTTVDAIARREWSDSYLILTQALPDERNGRGQAFRGNPAGRWVNWISSQSAPEPLPPYSAGAARSELLPLLEAGHQGVRLARDELDKIACWIDLLVPFCGDYAEANAWTMDELQKFTHFQLKRRQMAELEQENIRQLLDRR